MSIHEAFAAVLRQFRSDRGFSQEELGLTADLSRGYISQLERAMNIPTMTTLFAIADALQVRPSDMIARVERLMGR